jgi:hypothetical protein
VRLVDRTKDLIKSGGEWIGSVELENEIMARPKVAEAAVIAIPSEKWVERPMACVVVKPGETLTAEEIIEFLTPRVAKWWLPDAVEFIDEVPKTSVGKFSKKTLREKFGGYRVAGPTGRDPAWPDSPEAPGRSAAPRAARQGRRVARGRERRREAGPGRAQMTGDLAGDPVGVARPPGGPVVVGQGVVGDQEPFERVEEIRYGRRPSVRGGPGWAAHTVMDTRRRRSTRHHGATSV